MADVEPHSDSGQILPDSSSPFCLSILSELPAIQPILDVICRTTGLGFAVLAQVTDRKWVACAVLDRIDFGVRPGGELDLETTICHEIRRHRQPVVIDNVAESVLYCDHPTPKMYRFQSYISVPVLLPDGTFFGTLCALDPQPRTLSTPAVTEMFRLFSQLIAFQLDAQAKVASTQADLRRERDAAELREQFIAVLGHDLRNPLAAITAGARRLQRTPADRELVTAHMVQAAGRMARLIDNVLDFARGRLGGGLALAVGAEPLEPILRQVLSETQTSSPDRVIQVDIALPRPVLCDASRIGQLFSNLLGNAVSHGSAEQPIRVSAQIVGDMMELSVANGGDPIPPEALEHLFHPFFRGKLRRNQNGLGLGLYIAAEIARAHHGTLSVQSDPGETRFTFRMPAGS